MAVSDGQPVNAAVTNAAYISRTQDSDTTARVTLDNTSDANSGPTIANAQRLINEIADSDGTNGEGDATRKTYSSTNYVTNGDDRKVAIGKLDAQAGTDATNLSNHIAANQAHGTTGDVVGTTDTQNLSNKTFTDSTSFTDTTSSTDKDTGAIVVEGGVGIEENLNVGGNTTITGDLTVNGTTTTVNTTTTEITDPNIVLNNNGDDASSEGSGITIERTGTDGSIVYEDALASKFKAGSVGSEVEVANVSSTQTFTNKDLSDASNTFPTLPLTGDVTGNTGANTVTAIRNANVPAPVSGNDGQAIIYDDASGDFIYGEAGGGAGLGGINYITNFSFEDDVSGWSTYADAAGETPVDGTGGTATTTFTRTTVGSEIQIGTASAKLAKDAADRQGEGVSFDFTIDPVLQSQVLEIDGFYSTSVGYADGDLRVYIYDVTNTKIIEPVPTELFAGEKQRFPKFYFQSSPDSTSYRLIFHVASTSTTAYDVFFDNVTVGPAKRNFGPVVSDSKAYTPVYENLGTVTNNFVEEQRTGPILSINGVFTTGTVTAGIASMSLPPGLSIDFTKMNDSQVVGKYFRNVTDAFPGGNIVVDSASPSKLFFTLSDSFFETTTNPITQVNGSGAFSNSDQVFIQVNNLIIEGWSSSQQISDDADTRVVAAKYEITTADTTTVGNRIDFDSLLYDTHSAVTTGSSWVFTCPSSGYYKVSAQYITQTISVAPSGLFAINLHLNGSFLSTIGYDISSSSTTRQYSPSGDTTVFCNKGDTIDLRYNTSAAGSLVAGAGLNYVTIEKLQGPSQIAANELIRCTYTSNSGQTLTNGDTLIFEDLVDDSHGSYDPSTGVFTAPASGKYQISATALTVSVTGTAGTFFALRVHKNGTFFATGQYDWAESSTARNFSSTVTTTIPLAKGDTMEIVINETIPAAATIISQSEFNNLCIERIGF